MKRIRPDKIIRIGDVVKVKETSKFIERVGYPLVWTQLIEEVENDPVCYRIMDLINDVDDSGSALRLKRDDIPFDLIRFVAMQRVKQRNFGGIERKIFYMDNEKTFGIFSSFLEFNLSKSQFKVVDKKIVKTGIRDSGYMPYSFGDYDCDYEPPSLQDVKTHVLIKLDGSGWYFDTSVWIHVEDVTEKIKDSRFKDAA